ncbi:PREDICTED: uncharacterized protein LOC104787536 [Camelina sativa]|uniref:Uncharacterized protein LOC104787536 n=1 Tax=Camelina sativa TaxID=90675 RepID=A0ABM0Z7C3_CAMSA|nr:PREDICTED: uncharacterized protein LOC104787536 [Camelina sativa]
MLFRQELRDPMTLVKAPFFVIFTVALLLLSPLFFGQLEATTTKQPEHRKLRNTEGERNRRNEIVVQIKARVKRSKSRRGPQKKEPYKKPPCKPPTHPA